MEKAHCMTSPLPTRNRNLDLIRLIAAILVLFSHSYPLAGRGSDEPFVLLLGHTGGDIAVSTFFVISGFLIAASYIRSQGVIDYLWKRCIRIFPALFCAVIFAIILGMFLTPLALGDYITHAQTIAYIQNIYLYIHYNLPLVFAENIYPHAVNGSLWTLPIEVFMYGVILVMGMAGILSAPFTILTAALCMAGIFALQQFPSDSPRIFLGVAELAVVLRLAVLFFMGAALYFYRKKIRYHGAVALLFCAIIFLTRQHPLGMYSYTLLLPYIIFYLASVNVPATDVITRRGDFSYGIYIYAFPVQQLVVYWSNNQISVFMLFISSFAITLCLAMLSWKFVEEPALRRWKPAPRLAAA